MVIDCFYARIHSQHQFYEAKNEEVKRLIVINMSIQTLIDIIFFVVALTVLINPLLRGARLYRLLKRFRFRRWRRIIFDQFLQNVADFIVIIIALPLILVSVLRIPIILKGMAKLWKTTPSLADQKAPICLLYTSPSPRDQA
eukprot:TRINITY_DN12978_c0_g1_i2.p3 TRINITY_DN12978_c0_g1~~TRINITY_DN12978_c0_g1_i2.p3  ORF type:complete len:142 (-),score=3.63 TRINITY_DN12978_c0_g1_i2:87-512(-)